MPCGGVPRLPTALEASMPKGQGASSMEFTFIPSKQKNDNVYSFEKQKYLVGGDHLGCLEFRERFNGVGEFDGQSTLIYFNDTWFLYTRANCGDRGYR